MKLSYNLLLNLVENYEKYEILYHGTSVEQDIDMILPPNKTNAISEKGRKKNLDKVFFTADYKSADIYAKRAVRSLGGIVKIYKVIPLGKVETLNETKRTTVFYTDSVVVITQKLEKIIKDMSGTSK